MFVFFTFNKTSYASGEVSRTDFYNIIGIIENTGIISKINNYSNDITDKEIIETIVSTIKPSIENSHIKTDNDSLIYQGIISEQLASSYMTRRELISFTDEYLNYINNKRFIISEELLDEKEYTYSEEPITVEELLKVFLYMAKEDIYSHKLKYTKKDSLKVVYDSAKSGISKNFHDELAKTGVAFLTYPEYLLYNFKIVTLVYKSEDYIELELILRPTIYENVSEIRNEFFDDTRKIIIDLIKQGKLHKDISDKEKYALLYDWVIRYLKYDDEILDINRIGYGAIKNKTASCGGYTALYNHLCRLAGLKVKGLATTFLDKDNHIWTVGVIDDKYVHIDTTWGDNGKPDYEYFMMSTEKTRKLKQHDWDEELFKLDSISSDNM